MSVPNEARPEPKNPQAFCVPLLVRVDSDGGGLRIGEVRRHLGRPLHQAVTQDAADRFDKDPDRPASFALDGVELLWGAAEELKGAGNPPEYMVAAWLSEEEFALLRFALDYVKHGLEALGDHATLRVRMPHKLEHVQGVLAKFGFDRKPRGETPTNWEPAS